MAPNASMEWRYTALYRLRIIIQIWIIRYSDRVVEVGVPSGIRPYESAQERIRRDLASRFGCRLNGDYLADECTSVLSPRGELLGIESPRRQ
jgi:hypothetical protein